MHLEKKFAVGFFVFFQMVWKYEVFRGGPVWLAERNGSKKKKGVKWCGGPVWFKSIGSPRFFHSSHIRLVSLPVSTCHRSGSLHVQEGEEGITETGHSCGGSRPDHTKPLMTSIVSQIAPKMQKKKE